MADKKISALDAATTPLAGTEVLPIVQSSTTKKVSVSDLTAGRAVTAGSMSIGGAVNAGWGSTTRVVQTALSGALSGSTASFRAVVSNNVYYDNTNWRLMYGIGASLYEQNAGSHYWFTAPTGTADAVANLTQVMSIVQSNNNLKVDVGNLVIGTAGKGIDFSANTNAPGMTSELLNWYEEGTFTPTVLGTTTAGTATYGTQLGTYTRIGRMVYFQLELIWSSGTGAGQMRLGGLPFTCGSSNCAVSIGDVENIVLTASYYMAGAYVSANSTQISLRECQVGGGGNNPVTYDAAGTIRVGGCYYV